MLKKFIYGALLMATFAGGTGFFTSCKDSDEDWKNELQSQQITLEDLLKKLQGDLSTCQQNCSTKIAALEEALRLANTELGTKLNEQQVRTIVSELLSSYATQSALDALEEKINNFPKCECDLSKYATKKDLEDAIAELNGLVSPDVAAILDAEGAAEALQSLLDNQANLASLASNYQEIMDLLAAEPIDAYTKAEIDAKIQEFTQTISGLSQSIQTLNSDLNDLTTRVGNLEGYFKLADGTTMSVTDFQKAIKDAQWVGDNMAALQAIVNKKTAIDELNADNIKALNEFLENNTFNELAQMYTTLFPDGIEWGDVEKLSYIQVVEKLNALDVVPGQISDLTNRVEELEKLVARVAANEKAIAQLRTQVSGVFGRLNEMVTGLILQASTNSIIGNINTPFGVNSMVLMTYFGELKTGLHEFPANGVGAEFDSKDGEGERAGINWAAVPNAEFTPLTSNVIVDTDENGRAYLGDLWFTVNPGTVEGLNVNNFSLVNSVEDGSKVKVTNVVKDDNTLLTFGYSRAAGNGNGLYRAQAMVDANRLQDIKIHIEPNLIETLKEAVHNRTVTNAAHVVKQIYNQLQDVCEANALRYTYEAVTGYDENGNEIKGTQKVYSEYGIAATSFKPLGFGTLYGTSFRTLPNWRNIEISKDLVNLNLGKFEIGKVTLNIELELKSIDINEMAETIITFEYPVAFDPATGEPTEYDTFEYNISDDMNSVISEIQTSIDQWLKGTGNGDGLEQDIKNQIAAAVDEAFNGTEEKPGLVKDIENQVNDMMGKIQKKLYSLVDDINTDYIGKINRVGSYYQRLANRINNVLTDPNHYLQAMMIYRTADGNFARLSDTYSQPTVFRGEGEAIELWATNYCFETICPIYKKFVGVTKVTYTDGTNTEDLTSTLGAAANNHDHLMATPFSGRRAQIALDIKGADKKGVYTYEIAYQGLDYTGHTSTNKYYIMVVR